MRAWINISIVLFLIGSSFILFRMKGYLYITAVCYLAAVSIVVYHIAPDTLKRVFFVLLGVGLVYFLTVEFLVVGQCRGDNNGARSHLIVLGAAVKGDQPSLSLTHRIEAAESYLTSYPESKAVLSGGQGDDEMISEAQCMFNVLTSHGIDPDRLILEDKSTSTKENLNYSKELILEDGGKLDDVAIVSSPYHLYRAKTMAADSGFVNIAGVACVHGYPIYSLGMYIREAFGITHLWIFGD